MYEKELLYVNSQRGIIKTEWRQGFYFCSLKGKYLIVQYVRHPGGEEGRPPDEDHVADLGLCQVSGNPIEVNQSHPRSHTGQGPHCQSENGRNEAN